MTGISMVTASSHVLLQREIGCKISSLQSRGSHIRKISVNSSGMNNAPTKSAFIVWED